MRGALASLLLVFLAWPSASEGAAPAQLTSFEIPRTANQWKRPYLKAVREVWGLTSPAWLAAQVGQESGWRDGLTSRVGAKGMCQFMDATATGLEKQQPGLAALGRYSPSWCFKAQAILMKQLYDSYVKVRDPCNAIKFAGSAYNGGPYMLSREAGLCLKDKDCNFEHWDENVAPKRVRAIWAWKENRDYVFRITQRSQFYAIEGWGDGFCQSPASVR